MLRVPLLHRPAGRPARHGLVAAEGAGAHRRLQLAADRLVVLLDAVQGAADRARHVDPGALGLRGRPGGPCLRCRPPLASSLPMNSSSSRAFAARSGSLNPSASSISASSSSILARYRRFAVSSSIGPASALRPQGQPGIWLAAGALGESGPTQCFALEVDRMDLHPRGGEQASQVADPLAVPQGQLALSAQQRPVVAAELEARRRGYAAVVACVQRPGDSSLETSSSERDRGRRAGLAGRSGGESSAATPAPRLGAARRARPRARSPSARRARGRAPARPRRGRTALPPPRPSRALPERPHRHP